MHVRKTADFDAMFASLDALMASGLPQIELYCKIGGLVSNRPEKGAAVAAAGYLSDAHPDRPGFSPRNLRRMREFYRTYERTLGILDEAMSIGWTQNVVILEADLTFSEKTWYIRAVRRFGWSKVELQRRISANAHLEMVLDFADEMCYTEENTADTQYANHDTKSACLTRTGHLFTENRRSEYTPHMRRRVRWQNISAARACRPP